MSDETRLDQPGEGEAELAEVNEADEVLAVLRGLLAAARHPVVRACLEGAVEDIEHLVGGEGDGLDGPG